MKYEDSDKEEKDRLFFLFRLSFFVGLAIYYLFLNVFPWGWIYEFGWYQGFTRVMSEIIPSITRLPPEARVGGPAHSIAQLSFIHSSGLVLAFVVILKTPRGIYKPSISGFRVVMLMLGWLLFTLMVSWLIFFWEGTFNVPVDQAYFGNKWEITWAHVFVWYCFIGCALLTSVTFLELLSRLKNAFILTK